MNEVVNTPSFDLMAPGSRFDATARYHSRLQRYRFVFGRYWWILPLVLGLVVIPVYLYTASLAPAYESKAKMWLAGKLTLSEGRVYTEDLENYLGTQAEVLRSQGIQQRALAKLGQSFSPSAAPAVHATPGWLSEVKSIQQGGADLIKSVLGLNASAGPGTNFAIPFKLSAAESAKSSVLELRAVGPDPRATRAFLDQVMGEYLQFKQETRANTTDRATTSIAGQAGQLANELKAGQEKLYFFQMSNNVVFLQEQGNSAANYLATITRQLANLRNEHRLLQMLQPEQLPELARQPSRAGAEPESPGETAGKSMLAALTGPQSELYKAAQQALLLKAKREELGQFLRPAHPKILKLNEDIATQEKLVQIARDEGLRQLNLRREALGLEIKNLEQAATEWEAKALDTSRKMAEYERLRQELQRLQTAHDRLQAVIQNVDISKTVAPENISILEPASVALPVNRMVRNLLLALAAGLALGWVLLGIIYLLDDRFATLRELRGHFSEVVVGQIPEIPLKKPKRGLELALLERQRFEFLEAFRNIRSSLLFMGNGQGHPKTLLVSSSVPKEGKSTISLYLAATLAMGGSRVLLVDGDMRRTALHKYFKASASPGLAEILNDETQVGKAVMPTEIANLSFLPAGAAKRNPGELVLSQGWRQMLEKVAGDYDFILIDSPPVLAADDACCLAAQVDGVLFVVRGAYTSARAAHEALQTLQQRHAKVLGLILNRAGGSGYDSYQYQKYKRSYGWHPSDKKQLASHTAGS